MAPFAELCAKHGIRHEFTAPYSPQQNGIAERKNRTLKEIVTAMLISSGMSQDMWGEVILTATYLLNKIPLEAKQRKRSGKDNKKGGNLKKGQAAGDTDGEEDGTEGPMIIEAEMGGHCVHRMYVDGGSSSEILYEHCFNRFRPEVRNPMIPATTPLVGFSGEIIWPLGKISLLVKIGDEEHSTSAWMNFMVVRSPSPYNRIIGRPGVRRIQAATSTAHGMLKFPVTCGTVTLRSSMIIQLECIIVSGPRTQQPLIDQVTEEKIQVAIHPEYPKQTIAIGSTLTEDGREELC
ncbi:reverse transcriptase domain-containing protein, partial [Tanacetum coccineum]